MHIQFLLTCFVLFHVVDAKPCVCELNMTQITCLPEQEPIFLFKLPCATTATQIINRSYQFCVVNLTNLHNALPKLKMISTTIGTVCRCMCPQTMYKIKGCICTSPIVPPITPKPITKNTTNIIVGSVFGGLSLILLVSFGFLWKCGKIQALYFWSLSKCYCEQNAVHCPKLSDPYSIEALDCKNLVTELITESELICTKRNFDQTLPKLQKITNLGSMQECYCLCLYKIEIIGCACSSEDNLDLRTLKTRIHEKIAVIKEPFHTARKYVADQFQKPSKIKVYWYALKILYRWCQIGRMMTIAQRFFDQTWNNLIAQRFPRMRRRTTTHQPTTTNNNSGEEQTAVQMYPMQMHHAVIALHENLSDIRTSITGLEERMSTSFDITASDQQGNHINFTIIRNIENRLDEADVAMMIDDDIQEDEEQTIIEPLPIEPLQDSTSIKELEKPNAACASNTKPTPETSKIPIALSQKEKIKLQAALYSEVEAKSTEIITVSIKWLKDYLHNIFNGSYFTNYGLDLCAKSALKLKVPKATKHYDLSKMIAYGIMKDLLEQKYLQT